MNISHGAKRVVIAFWSRSLDGERMSGRLRIAHAIRHALDDQAILTMRQMPCVLTEPSVKRWLGVIAAGVKSLFRGPVLPLQCMLFASRADVAAMADIATATDAGERIIYLDGIRSCSLLKEIRRRLPDARIVVDFDDLMSRRMALLLKVREPLAPGYLSDRIPDLLRWLLRNPLAGAAIVNFERAALRAAERRCLELADAIVLVSRADGQVLAEVRAKLAAARAEIVIIPPPVTLERRRAAFTGPVARFVFIGSDALTQNRLTIDHLCRLWREHQPSTPLVIYGRQLRAIPYPPGVSAPGYVEDIDDVYDNSSVLLCPSFLGGGVKTKILEAFAHGAPVVGNARAFEGLSLKGYDLEIDDEAALVSLIADPNAYVDRLGAAAVAGMAYVRRAHSPGAFTRDWRRVLLAAPPRAAEASDRAAVAPIVPSVWREAHH